MEKFIPSEAAAGLTLGGQLSLQRTGAPRLPRMPPWPSSYHPKLPSLIFPKTAKEIRGALGEKLAELGRGHESALVELSKLCRTYGINMEKALEGEVDVALAIFDTTSDERYQELPEDVRQRGELTFHLLCNLLTQVRMYRESITHYKRVFNHLSDNVLNYMLTYDELKDLGFK